MRVRLLLLLLLVMTPAFGLAAREYVVVRQHAVAEAKEEALHRAQHIARDQERAVQTAQQLLSTLARLPEVRRQDPASCGALLADIWLRQSVYTNLGATRADGEVFCSALGQTVPVNLTDRAYFQWAMETGQFTVSEYLVGRQSGKANLTLAEPVVDEDGRPVGVVFAGLDLAWLSSIAAEAALPTGSTLTVIDRGGTVLVRSPDTGQVGRSFAGVPLFEAIRARGEGSLEANGLDGVPRLYAFTRLAHATDGSYAYIFIGIPTTAVLGDVDRKFWADLAVLVALTMLGAVAARIAADRAILRPVAALGEAARRLRAGEAHVRIGHAGGTPELTALVATFDDMSQALQARATERDQAAAALLQSQARYQAIVSNFPNGMVALLDHDLRYLVVDGQGLAAMGLAPEAMVGRTIWDLFTADVAGVMEAQYRAALAGEGSTLQAAYAGRVFLRHARPVGDATGKVVAVLVMTQDMTGRAQAEEALHESNRQLEAALTEVRAAQERMVQQERLSALGQMASGIAHDLNNALSLVIGYSELLLVDPAALHDPAMVRQYLELISTASEDASTIVGRLREFYRPREASDLFEPISLASLVAQVILLTQPRWRDQALARGVTIHVQTEVKDLPRLLGSPAELREALTNLIFNAVDAMPDGGTLAIRARPERGRAVLQVADTGNGMDEETRRRCLEPFFTTKGERGTGLGLGMVYGIVRRHEGTLEVDSAPGRGTTVTLCLPLEIAVESDQGRPAGVVHPSQHLRILVAEDDERIRRMLRDFLTAEGHAVETASDGREGLERFQPDRFDLVITDRAMPELHGDQLAAEVKRRAPQVSVIMLTGFGGLMATADERPLGVDLVVDKPITMTALRQAIARVKSHAA